MTQTVDRRPEVRRPRRSGRKKAAEGGSVLGRYFRALEGNDPEERKRWLGEAARDG